MSDQVSRVIKLVSRDDVYSDALLTSAVCVVTSLMGGFVIFSVLGYMAHMQNKHISKVATEGLTSLMT